MTGPATPTVRRWLAGHRRWLAEHRGIVVGGAAMLWGSGIVTFLALVIGYDLDFFGPIGGPYVLGFGAFAVVGMLIAWHRPGHLLALLFFLLGVGAPVSNTLIAIAMGPLAEQPLGLRTLLVAISVATTTLTFPLLPLAIVLFPDGRLPSARWRWLPWFALLSATLGGAAAFAAGGWGGDVDQTILAAPLSGSLLELAAVLSPPFFATLPILVASSVVAAVRRFRRGDAVTRQQLRWLAFAALVLLIILLGLLVSQGRVASPPGVPAVTISIGVALMPISVGIAILRHGLYDIDLVLNRAIVFVTLAGFITATYAVTVVGIGTAIGDATNVAVTIGATALVAVVFEPVRARVQHWANRLIYGHRATPYEVLTAVVDELDSTSLTGDQLEGLAALLADGTGASHATIWVEVGGSLRAAACAPTHDPGAHAPVTLEADSGVTIEVSSHVELVRLDDEVLGALSFARRRDDPVSPHDRELMQQMAGQAALVLGNARLRARLGERVEDLRVSRQQLVAAQDEARRRLERDLHDGAQQQLVALKVKLGLARTIAAKEGAGEPVTSMLTELAGTTDVAVDALRTLARGIYPPLLEAEGLERALATHLQRAPIPVDLRATNLGRYNRQIEATVYFCVLEAVRNAVSHADATRLTILLDEADDQLRFRVLDDGRGFDPKTVVAGLGLTNMRDRVDALAGSLTVEPGVDTGTRVAGSIPVSSQVAASPVEAMATP